MKGLFIDHMQQQINTVNRIEQMGGLKKGSTENGLYDSKLYMYCDFRHANQGFLTRVFFN